MGSLLLDDALSLGGDGLIGCRSIGNCRVCDIRVISSRNFDPLPEVADEAVEGCEVAALPEVSWVIAALLTLNFVRITNEDKSLIGEYIAKEIEARAGAARVAFEMVVEAISDAAQRDLRPVFRDALQDAADNIRQQSEDQGDMLDVMADELEAYIQQIENQDEDEQQSDNAEQG